MRFILKIVFDKEEKRHIICRLNAPIAQLDRAPGYELGGREFESLWARQLKKTGTYAQYVPVFVITNKKSAVSPELLKLLVSPYPA